ncbi:MULTISPECIES: anti-sigma factor family protein [Streptomyces]|uniref:Zf-HC2 domain-containing protein n=1 Tax=Streptomyces solicathayae TaxID=3081768 RepID=A0ABZ0LRZ2_9ACTN|nr:zf-HC2 domain-containing protein [Streptomyces sp. HUAS YS2]WOX22219.1 zf-HC2 domain-containing protein [Streptomyces sp. HUAS YS2]
MSSSSPSGPTPVEHHLGDRLAALVDGELGHDARERVLAHLATCPKCKAEADAQRSLKNVFAQAAPPPPSEGLLARLQGLPGGPGDPGGDGGGRGPFDAVGGIFGVRGDGVGGVRTDGFATAAPVDPYSGFRIHEVGRPAQDRSAWRGRRFAFAAASAVSFAAIALGGALPLEAAVEANARGEGTGASVTPLRSGGGAQGAGTGTGSTGTVTGTGTGVTVGTPTNRSARSAERPTPAMLNAARINAATTVQLQAPATPLLGLSPLIRPTGSALQSAFAPAFPPTATPEPTRLTAPTRPSDPLPSPR